jgi:hypothetical protein
VRRDDWSASWIWCKGDSRPRNFYLYARKAFKLSTKPTNAPIRITADSRYKIYVNGVFVGSGPVCSDPRRLSYDTYDIAEHLTKGQNAIAVLVHHIGQGTYSYIPGRAAFICEANIELEDGSEKIVTDETWRVLPAEAWTQAGRRMSRRLGWQEVYDANLEQKDWTSPKFKDSKWQEAAVIGRSSMQPFDRLVPREIPHLKEELVRPVAVVSIYDCPPLPKGIEVFDIPGFMSTEDLQPAQQSKFEHSERLFSEKDDAATAKIPQSSGMAVILDFGREVFGNVELAFTRSNGGIIDIGYSEALEGGRVKPDRGEVAYSDRLILRKGKQVWTSFEPRAFRYIQLDIRDCPKPIAISNVIVRETTYPVEWRGNFESSDEQLNQIWKTAANTARLCMHDTYIDSPWRERAQWWDNASVASQVAYYAFGDTNLLRQGLKHIAASQDRDGIVLALYPSATWEQFPDFGALWVMSVWDYYAMSEDKSILDELYPAVVRWLRWIGRFTDSDGLLSKVRGDLFIDWAEIDRRGEVAALNCLYIGALRAACRMAEVLRRKSDAEEWAGTALTVKMAIAKHFWSPGKGLFADARVDGKLQEHYSIQTNILAALFDVADHYQKSSIYRQALDERNLPPISTPRFMSLLVEGLFRSGFSVQAVQAIKRKWGGMITDGATTFWEHFDPAPNDSRCYGSSVGPGYQLPAYVLGVKPTGEPRRVSIEPHLADLDWAKGVVPMAVGPLYIEWRTMRRGFFMTIEVPRGVIAEVVPPRETIPCRVLVDDREKHDTNIEVGHGVHRIQVLNGSSRRSRRQACTIAESDKEHALAIPPGRADIETVEQMIRILTELEKEQAERAAREALESAAPEANISEKRKRHRRGRRSKSNGHQEEPAVEIQNTAAEEVAIPAVESVEIQIHVEAEPERYKSRRRRRRTSTHPEESVQTESTVETIVPVEEQVQPEPALIENAHPTKRSRRRTKKTVVEVVPQVEQEAPQLQTQETVVISEATPVDEPTQERRKPSRRRRKSAPVAEDTASVEASAPIIVEPQLTVEAPIESAEPTTKHHRPRGRRRKTIAPVAEVAEPIVEAPMVEVPTPEVTPEVQVSSDSNGKKPRRQYRRRREPAQPSEPAETS